MGASLNDIIKIGNFSFDLQTEAVENFVIGEIFHNGKVLKRIKKPRDLSLPERADIQNLHNHLKELLITKLTSFQTKEQKSDRKKQIIDNSDKIKEELLRILELEEDNLDLFFYKSKNNEIVSSNKKSIALNFHQLVEQLNTKISKFPKFKEFKMILFTTDKKNLFLILRHKESAVLFLFSGTKLAFIRKNMKKHVDKIMSLLV